MFIICVWRYVTDGQCH